MTRMRVEYNYYFEDLGGITLNSQNDKVYLYRRDHSPNELRAIADWAEDERERIAKGDTTLVTT